MHKKIALVLFIITVSMMLMSGDVVFAYVRGPGATHTKCASGYGGVLETVDGNCRWVLASEGSARAVVWYGAGQVWKPGVGQGYEYGYQSAYVPYTGIWKMGIHFCPGAAPNTCTLAKSAADVKSAAAVVLSSNSLISDQNPDFNGFSTVVGFSANVCYTFVDSEGNEWKSDGEFMCADAHDLPDTPSACYLNYGEDLDVDMGTLERRDIVTTPGTSVSTVKKTVSVLCTRDAGVTVRTSFQFTPLTIGDKDVIKSSSNGLGIAIRYNHKIVSPSDSFTEDYALGYTNIELEFEAVRDPTVAVKDVPTGGFTANAVMVMTQE